MIKQKYLVLVDWVRWLKAHSTPILHLRQNLDTIIQLFIMEVCLFELQFSPHWCPTTLSFISQSSEHSANTALQPYLLFGWFRVSPFRRTGIHGVTRSDLGDYWVHIYGQRRLCKGSYGHTVTDGHHFWLEMWVTQTKQQTHLQGE